MKKFLCISIALLMLLAALAACTEKTPDATNAPTDDSSDSDVVDATKAPETNDNGDLKIETDITWEDLDFQNVEVNIAARPDDRYRREFSSKTQQDPVDNRIFKRNSTVEKALNITLGFTEAADFWSTDGIVQFVQTEHQSGVNSKVDIVAPYAAYAVTPSLRGYYVNLASDAMTYMDITKGYWNQTYVKNALCYGQLYYIVGDLNLTIYDKAIVCFANMDLAQANNINPDDLYAAVENKAWNYNYFYDLLNNFTYLDKNENNVVDAQDVVPITTIWSSEGCDAFCHAWEIQFLQTNDNGSHTLTIDGNSKLELGVTMMQDMYAVEGALLLTGVGPSFDCFLAGNALFDIDIIYRNADVCARLRNADFTYALLPLPMYDDSQTEYHTTSQDAYNTMSVMSHHEDELDAIGAALEYLSYLSYEDVRPFYIEKMVKATYISGAKPVKMIEYAMDGVTFDTATIYHGQVGTVSVSMWRSAIAGGISASERWAAKRSEIENAVQDFDSWFQATMD